MSSLRKGHANIPCVAPSLADDPQRQVMLHEDLGFTLRSGGLADGGQRQHDATSRCIVINASRCQIVACLAQFA